MSPPSISDVAILTDVPDAPARQGVRFGEYVIRREKGSACGEQALECFDRPGVVLVALGGSRYQGRSVDEGRG